MPVEICNFNPCFFPSLCYNSEEAITIDIDEYIPSFELPENPLLGRMQLNWRDCILLAGLVITVASTVAALFMGYTFWAIALLVDSIAQGSTFYYMKHYETYQELIDISNNLRDTNEELQQRNCELQEIGRDLNLQIANLGQQNGNLRKTNNALEQNVSELGEQNHQLQDRITELYNATHNLDERVERLRQVELDLTEKTRQYQSQNDRYQELLERKERQHAILDKQLRDLNKVKEEFLLEREKLQAVREEMQRLQRNSSME